VLDHLETQDQLRHRALRVAVEDVTLAELERGVGRAGHADGLGAGIDSEVADLGQHPADLAGDDALSASEADRCDSGSSQRPMAICKLPRGDQREG
jgi:hypothetical protein